MNQKTKNPLAEIHSVRGFFLVHFNHKLFFTEINKEKS